MRVVDNGKVVQAGKSGELQIKASIIEGYWGQPEATKEAFDGDWLRTGDVGYIDAEGYVYIIDRIKDLVIRGGKHFHCGSRSSTKRAYGRHRGGSLRTSRREIRRRSGGDDIQ